MPADGGLNLVFCTGMDASVRRAVSWAWALGATFVDSSDGAGPLLYGTAALDMFELFYWCHPLPARLFNFPPCLLPSFLGW